MKARVAAALTVLSLAIVPATRPHAADSPTDVPLSAEAPGSYEVRYEARIVPTERAARVSIRVVDAAGHFDFLRFKIDPKRHLDFEGDGEIEADGDHVRWKPPGPGGTLRYVFRIDALRDELSYDARCAADWALFRGDDLVPPARVSTSTGAVSHASLRLRLPAGWSAATPFERTARHTWRVENPRRRFDRPVGWMVMAKRFGVLRERVAGVYVAVAGPVGHGLRRLDTLAFLRWNLPVLRKTFDVLPERLLVVGAGDPMWRGGLSGPNSLFLHADRPLMTSDGTSPLLHELVHTIMRNPAAPLDDWIVEGIAELYALEALVRSRTISRRRYEKFLGRLAERGATAPRLRVEAASGAVTARAVTVLRALDREIRARTEDRHSLDDVVRTLAARNELLTTEALRAVAEAVVNGDLGPFFQRQVGK
jgi:hypothetical protein